MFHNFRDPFTLIVSAAAFGLVLSIWFAILLIWHARRSTRSRKIEQRLGIGGDVPISSSWSGGDDNAPGRVLRLWRDGAEATTVVPGTHPTFGARLDRLRTDAGLETPLPTLLIGLAAILLVSFVVGMVVSRSPLISAGAAAAMAQLIWIFISQRITRRRNVFGQQFVDALELAARSLRVGHPLVGSFQLIASEVGAPVGTVFADIVQQQGLGMSLEEAIRRAADDTPSADLKFFATSVVIQIRSGGNLADMMDRLATVLRDRMRLTRRVRVLTAQTQFSKRILLALPILTLVALNMINPEYMSVLWTTNAGHMVLFVAGAGLLIGGWTMTILAKQKV